MKSIDNGTDKQYHLTLPSDCWSCLMNDIFDFSTEENPLKRNTIINIIIRNSIGDCPDLCRPEAMSGQRHRLDPENGTVKFRLKLNTATIRRLEEYGIEEWGFVPCFRELLIRYAALDFAKRERILFRDICERIDDAINGEHPLILTTGNKRFKVRPWRLLTAQSYNYLVGYSLGNDDERAASFRLSRISSISVKYSESSALDNNERKALTEAVKTKGVPYLLNNETEIRVLLTPIGEKRYRSILHNRPRLFERRDAENGRAEYVFRCTEWQAFRYFVQFGGDAVITEPAELRDRACRFFKEAAKAYEEPEGKD